VLLPENELILSLAHFFFDWGSNPVKLCPRGRQRTLAGAQTFTAPQTNVLRRVDISLDRLLDNRASRKPTCLCFREHYDSQLFRLGNYVSLDYLRAVVK
jgi:hypothetical protein